MSSGQDNVCLSVDVMWSGYMSPSGDKQKVIWRSGMSLDAYPGLDAGLEISKHLSSQAR